MKYKLIEDHRKDYLLRSAEERFILNDFQLQQGDFHTDRFSDVDQYDYYDLIIYSGGSKMLIESKIRTFSIDRFINEGAYVDNAKVILLKKLCSTNKAKLNDLQPYVVQVFPDGNKAKIVFWNLFQPEIMAIVPELKKVQLNQCGDKAQGSKLMINLPFNCATIYEFNYASDYKQRAKHFCELTFFGNKF